MARSYDDAVWYVRDRGIPDFISFDHDLGLDWDDPFAERMTMMVTDEKTGYDFAKWLCQHALDNQVTLRGRMGYDVHSRNPIGAENIRRYLENFMEAQDG